MAPPSGLPTLRTHAPPRKGARNRRTASSGRVAKPPALLAGVSVLVIEDDPPSLRLLRAVLEGEGCQLRVATSAEEGVAVLESFRPRIIVIDLILPLMSGLVLAQMLKANPLTSGIPLVAMTAFNGPAAQRLALDNGFGAYVRKPMDPASFCQLLLDHLGGES